MKPAEREENEAMRRTRGTSDRAGRRHVLAGLLLPGSHGSHRLRRAGRHRRRRADSHPLSATTHRHPPPTARANARGSGLSAGAPTHEEEVEPVR